MKVLGFLIIAWIAGCNTRTDKAYTEIGVHEDHESISVGSRKEADKASVTVEGIVSGFDCAVVGLPCPTTHRGADYTNGVFTEDGRFFFVVNIPQAFLTRHFLEHISVTGTTYGPHKNAVEPEQVYLVTETASMLIYDEGYYIDADGRKSAQFVLD